MVFWLSRLWKGDPEESTFWDFSYLMIHCRITQRFAFTALKSIEIYFLSLIAFLWKTNFKIFCSFPAEARCRLRISLFFPMLFRINVNLFLWPSGQYILQLNIKVHHETFDICKEKRNILGNRVCFSFLPMHSIYIYLTAFKF